MGFTVKIIVDVSFLSAKFKVYFAPGRVNLIGEHTDYNGGHVFPCALTIGTYAVVREREDRILNFYSINFEDLGIITSSIDNLTYNENENWINYPKAVIWALKDEGYEINHGFDVVYYGNIPNGAGLSSSASLEVLTAYILKDMFKLDIDNTKIALIGQKAENKYVGVNCGIMDQFVISNGKFDTQLINTVDYEKTDSTLDAYINQINLEYSELGNRKVGYSEVDLITHDDKGNRLVRNAETNLGDLCADAIRSSMDADIGYVNGGGIRSNIPSGDVTFNNLLSVFPFNNTVVLASISGQTIKDMLEMTMMKWPGEDGCFPHLSGITLSVNTSIPSSVEVNELEEFQGVSGEYRVYDIKIYNRETKAYESLILDKQYTIAATNYFLLDYGSGMTMFRDVEVLRNDGMLDVEALERYVVDDLDGRIGQEYANTNININFI